MIVEYNRPDNIESALELLSRKDPLTLPLGGGTVLNQQTLDHFAVVDLQSLGLNKITNDGKSIVVGATVSLQQALNENDIHAALKKAIKHEATYNIRQIATIAGSLVAADGRSPLATVMLAVGSNLIIQPGDEERSLGDFLPFRKDILPGRMITKIQLPLLLNLSYEYIARTPADRPIVCVSVARWKSGRVRVVLGGYGDSPILAFDGRGSSGAPEAAQSAYSEAGDQWASSEYRREMASVLTKRCLES